jgi:hypothetical protein
VAAAQIVETLACGRAGCACGASARKGAGTTHCPAHTDNSPSLSVNEEAGTVLLNCFAGCSQKAVNDALRKRGLWPEGGRGYVSPGNASNLRTPPYTVAMYAEEKRLPLLYLQHRGLTEIAFEGSKAVRTPFRTEQGEVVTSQYRTATVKKFKAGAATCLYGLELLAGYRRPGASITLCEGASDQQTLDFHEFPALGLPGASNWRDDRDASYFDGFETIYVIIEPDRGGEAVRGWLGRSSIRDRARLVTLGAFKDPSAMNIDAPERFKERYQEALDSAPAWADVEAERTRQEAEAAAVAAGDLMDETDIIGRARKVITGRGYAGDTAAPALVFVAIVSRLLPRPMNLALVAPSAAGKNEAVRAGAALHPPEAVHTMSAGSARALIYDDNDFTNRYIIVEEADSIPDEGPVASAIRAIAETGAMTYDVVECHEKTGKWGTRHIVKPGPTGLITTATKSIEHQLGTRVIEIPVSDSEAQTREVMRIHARRAAGALTELPGVAAWIAFQRWLEAAGERRVVVPFAEALVELLPTHLVRLRRDSAQLLSCIAAVAVLHQRHRERMPGGEVIASLADYAAARDLLAPIFDAIATEGVSDAIRETVGAILEGEEISQAALAARLNVSKGTISYRVNRALRDGWLANNESNPRKPKKLMKGAPLPELNPALPSVEAVREGFEGSNEFRPTYTPSPPDREPSEPSPPAHPRARELRGTTV